MHVVTLRIVRIPLEAIYVGINVVWDSNALVMVLIVEVS